MQPMKIRIREERENQHAINPAFCFGMPWSEEDNTMLLSLARNGRTRRESALILGRTLEAVKKQSKDLGVRFVRDSPGGFRTRYEVATYENRKEQEERDRTFIRALAVAIYRGDHLPGASARA